MDTSIVEYLKLMANRDLVSISTLFCVGIICLIVGLIIACILSELFEKDLWFFYFLISFVSIYILSSVIYFKYQDNEVNRIEQSVSIIKTIEKIELDNKQIEELGLNTETFMINNKKVTPKTSNDTIYKQLDDTNEKPYIVLEYIDYRYKPFSSNVIKSSVQEELKRVTDMYDYVLLKELHYK